jgi:hypothetical protein
LCACEARGGGGRSLKTQAARPGCHGAAAGPAVARAQRSSPCG